MADVIIEDHTEEVKEAAAQAIARALEAVGLQAEGYAKLLAPVDTGRLRASIIHEQENDTTEIIGTAVEYAPYVEFGTSRTKPKHFMQNAIQNHVAEYQEIFEEYMKNA